MVFSVVVNWYQTKSKGDSRTKFTTPNVAYQLPKQIVNNPYLFRLFTLPNFSLGTSGGGEDFSWRGTPVAPPLQFPVAGFLFP